MTEYDPQILFVVRTMLGWHTYGRIIDRLTLSQERILERFGEIETSTKLIKQITADAHLDDLLDSVETMEVPINPYVQPISEIFNENISTFRKVNMAGLEILSEDPNIKMMNISASVVESFGKSHTDTHF